VLLQLEEVSSFLELEEEPSVQEVPFILLPEQHPEYVVHMWLGYVEFDLDLARLTSPSEFKVQSHDATVEGTGLLLAWNEVDRRIEDRKSTRLNSSHTT
jgi:hypothetical protein